MKGAGSSSSARSGHGALLPATTNCRLPGGLTRVLQSQVSNRQDLFGMGQRASLA